MHEIGIVRQIVRTVEDFAARNDVKRIAVIEGTILEHAELVIHETPGLAECEDCDEIFNVVEHKGYCPNCGSFNKTVLSGRDCTIKEIRIAEDA